MGKTSWDKSSGVADAVRLPFSVQQGAAKCLHSSGTVGLLGLCWSMMSTESWRPCLMQKVPCGYNLLDIR